ncbi:phosphorylcholine phosphatase [Beauveria bassiana ARSEF 2860]|uniref:Phosphorylcholine phosphatase n=1 Tax=Beauveria bassiana (strain ARSEF 2860) TaxID=655819 RepID=J5JX59_BEAB2|nr:phosphorylcholine phosphatase [Beauveria bassiana ARSEF 2860]EJP66871.1 phosphorylcholine phosphatase [Beauveria bassiana ARSEF 2860]
MTYKPKPEVELEHWPTSAAKQLNDMIAANAHKGHYACFDMDDTSWQFDLESCLLPFLENKGVLSRATLDSAIQIIPFKDSATKQESLYSYSTRLYELGDSIYYSFSTQVFSNIPLRDLKNHVDELMASTEPVPSNCYEGDDLVQIQIHPPKIFRGQVELYQKLMANGIDVFVITAASEEIVRMVASDPKYGYNVKPENVIGTTLLLKNLKTGSIQTSRKQIADGTYNAQAVKDDGSDLVMIPYLWAPATWKIGKWAAILSYIDEWKMPILVAGDSPGSDAPMLFHGVDVARGGIRLLVARNDEALRDFSKLRKQAVCKQKEAGLPPTADDNWIVVHPKDLL